MTAEDREWTEHQQDHAREHRVAEDTARRLEREVEASALRLQGAVATALQAVTETAKVHSEAHNREHLAHERIHAVEKAQVEKAEMTQRAEAQRLADSLAEYKKAANEWRGSLSDLSATMITREVFEAYQKEREIRLQSAVDRVITLERESARQSDIKALDARVVKAETGSASGEAVESVRTESRRQRNGFLVAAALLGLGVVVNLLVNLLQQGSP